MSQSTLCMKQEGNLKQWPLANITFFWSQVNLLCSFLNQETALRIKATSLRSLNFMYGSCWYFHVSAQLVESLLGLLMGPHVQYSLQYEALNLLQKVTLRYAFPID